MTNFRTLGWSAGMFLVLGLKAVAQDGPCSIPPCMPSMVEARQRSAPPQRGPQNSPQVNPPLVPPPGMTEPNGMPPNTQVEQEQAKMRNTDRQRKLMADTEKLLNLANELKSDVDKSTKDMLSLEVIKKADEIEKLAHSVKEKMKGS